MNDTCPRCGGRFWPFDGNDVSCMNCSYIKKGESNHDDLSEVMATAPGMPMPVRSERHGVEVRRARGKER